MTGIVSHSWNWSDNFSTKTIFKLNLDFKTSHSAKLKMCHCIKHRYIFTFKWWVLNFHSLAVQQMDNNFVTCSEMLRCFGTLFFEQTKTLQQNTQKMIFCSHSPNARSASLLSLYKKKMPLCKLCNSKRCKKIIFLATIIIWMAMAKEKIYTFTIYT